MITLTDIKDRMKNIEANIVGCFWFNPYMFYDYSDITIKDFKNEVWKLYFQIGKKMASKNIKKIDDVAVEMFLEGKESLLNAYNKNGGYDTIVDLECFSSIDNIESYISELKKWNSIYGIIENFSFSEDVMKKIQDLNVEEVYRYYSATLNNIFININDDVNTSKLNDGISSVISEAHEGLAKGMPINSEILSSEIGGWINGQTKLIGGLSGAGKTTFVQEVYLSAVWQMDEACVIMLNEQDNVKWKQQFLTWIINNIILEGSSASFNSKRWREGGFTDEEFGWLRKAEELLKEKTIGNKIILAEFKSYSQKKAERMIKKYADLGVKKFILDTFKLSSDSKDEAFWLSMQEDMRKFDDLVKKSNLNVGLLCTLQLQKGSRLLRYLTSDNIGMAKNTIDVASVALLMRRVWNDEYPGCSNELKVKKPIQGTECFEEVILDPKKKYVVVFIEKNRNGESQTYQVVAEQDLGKLVYREIGITDIPVS